MVMLYNQSHEPQTINNGDRVAQMVITPFIKCEFEESDDLDQTERGEGGFGSTGEK